MRILSVIVASLAALGFVLYGAYFWAFPSVTVRYRLTLEVNVDEKIFVGSGVIEVTRQDTTRVFGSMGGVGAIIKGEAVAVDLGKKGQIFAILHGRKVEVAEDQTFPSYILFYAFAPQLDKNANSLD